MGSRLNYLDIQSSRQPRQIHSCTHTRTHTHSVWNSFPFASLRLRVLSSTSPPSVARLKLSSPFRFYLSSSFFILIFSFLLQNNFLLHLLRQHLCLTSLATDVFMDSPCTLVSAHKLSLSMSLPSEVCAKMSPLSSVFFFALLLSLYLLSL